MKTLSFDLEVRSISEAGEFVGLAATYSDKPDLVGDIIDPGAFVKTLQEKGSQRVLLWNHDVSEPVGTCLLSDTALGLECRGVLDLDSEIGRTTYSRLKKRIIRGLSIGFRAAKERYVAGVRHLVEIALFEISLTALPADERALVSAVKSIKTIRDFEGFLHESGFSKRESAALASHGFGALETAEADTDADVADEFSRWLQNA